MLERLGESEVSWRWWGIVAEMEVSKFELEQALTVSVAVSGLLAAEERLKQFPNFPGRQLSQDCFAFTQAQPLQEPVLLHLQHAIHVTQTCGQKVELSCAYHGEFEEGLL